jgi:polygalacturonase
MNYNIYKMRMLGLCLLLLFSFVSGNKELQKKVEKDKIFPELKWPDETGARKTPAGKKIFRVSEYGAISDGKTLNTVPIQKAIDECYVRGGGVVVFDTGSYLTGSLFVKKGVNLNIGKNVRLLGSQNIEDYPEIDTRIAGMEMKWPAALINVLDQDNVAISGEGTVHAQGKPFWDKYWQMRREYEKKGLRWIVDYDCKRPRTLLISGSSNVTVNKITLKQAGFWTVQILYSKYITVDGIVIQNNVDGSGPSTDGIDIDSSSWILVQNCDIDCNDDDFCLKAGRDVDGLRVNRPTEYVVIRNCVARKGAGLITCGSETSGGIRNVLAYNLIANGTTNCINFKSAITRGGTVENIYVHDIEMNSVGTMLRATMDWNPSYSYSTLPKEYSYDSIPDHWKVMLKQVSPEQGTPHFKNVFLTGMKGTVKGSAVSISGMKESPIENYFLTDVKIEARSAGDISFAEGWKFKNVTIKATSPGPMKIQNSTDMDVKIIEDK